MAHLPFDFHIKGGEEVVLVLKIDIDGGRGHACFPGDLGHGGVGQAIGVDEHHGGIENGLSFVFVFRSHIALINDRSFNVKNEFKNSSHGNAEIRIVRSDLSVCYVWIHCARFKWRKSYEQLAVYVFCVRVLGSVCRGWVSLRGVLVRSCRVLWGQMGRDGPQGDL